MYFVKSYFAFVFALLFIKSENAISRSNKNVTSGNNSIENIQDSSIEYKVAAYFVDKKLNARSAVQTYGRSLESIMKNLNNLRNGLGIIIEKVWVVRKNRKEELLKNIPPEFMRETDSLLKKHWTEQYRKTK